MRLTLSKNSSPSIEILLSTLNDGIFNIQFCHDFDYLVIHQVTNIERISDYDEFEKQLIECGIRYIRSYERGLSKSRNIGLNNALGDYVWIMDDDVLIHKHSRKKILEYIDNYPEVSMYVLNYSSDRLQMTTHKKEQYMNILSVMSVASINMLIRKDCLEGIGFDERFGLGTKYSSGEEYLLCCRLLKRNYKIFQTSLIFSYHPPITSGQDFYSTPYKLAAKKKMFICAHGKFFGIMWYLAFLIKKSPILLKNKSIINIIKSFWW